MGRFRNLTGFGHIWQDFGIFAQIYIKFPPVASEKTDIWNAREIQQGRETSDKTRQDSARFFKIWWDLGGSDTI